MAHTQKADREKQEKLSLKRKSGSPEGFELNALLWQINIDPPITEWVDFWTFEKEK